MKKLKPHSFQVVLKENFSGVNNKAGLKVESSFQREKNVISLITKITNYSDIVITDFEVKMKPNFFDLGVDKLTNAITIFPNQTQTYNFTVNPQGNGDPTNNPTIPLNFVMGAKTTLDIFYFNVPCMFHNLLVIFCFIFIIVHKKATVFRSEKIKYVISHY
jgi:hypothetical protein